MYPMYPPQGANRGWLATPRGQTLFFRGTFLGSYFTSRNGPGWEVGADASLDWESVRFRTINGLYMTGTRFLDASRNLSNIGTINSGAITSTGIITGTQ